MASPKSSNPMSRLRLYLSMVRYGNAHNRDFAHEHYAFFADMQVRLQEHVGDLRGLRVLDLGCGKAFWLTLLLHSWGACATGIDTELVTPGRSLGKYAGILHRNGPERALRTLFWDMAYATPYYRELEAVCPFPLHFERVDVRQMSITSLDLADDTFDLVVSHEVFEHLPDIASALRSLHRILKPGGMTYIYVHNYTSLSGGHHIAWKYPDSEPSTVVPPWDHLRENRYPEIPSWINRLRMQDYQTAFKEQFEILHWLPTNTEGESLLTPEIQAELSDYSEEELLAKGFIVIARPSKDHTDRVASREAEVL